MDTLHKLVTKKQKLFDDMKALEGRVDNTDINLVQAEFNCLEKEIKQLDKKINKQKYGRN